MTLSEHEVRACFSLNLKEFEALLGLYRLAVSNWDEVEYVLEGKPEIGEKGWRVIYDLFCRFNEDHPGENVFPGGLWLGSGFVMNKDLGAWEVDTSSMKFILKE